jgi:hypothetical protein
VAVEVHDVADGVSARTVPASLGEPESIAGEPMPACGVEP